MMKGCQLILKLLVIYCLQLRGTAEQGPDNAPTVAAGTGAGFKPRAVDTAATAILDEVVTENGNSEEEGFINIDERTDDTGKGVDGQNEFSSVSPISRAWDEVDNDGVEENSADDDEDLRDVMVDFSGDDMGSGSPDLSVESDTQYVKVEPNCARTFSDNPAFEPQMSSCSMYAFLNAYSGVEDFYLFASLPGALGTADLGQYPGGTGPYFVLDGSIRFHFPNNTTRSRNNASRSCVRLQTPPKTILFFEGLSNGEGWTEEQKEKVQVKVYDYDAPMDHFSRKRIFSNFDRQWKSSSNDVMVELVVADNSGGMPQEPWDLFFDAKPECDKPRLTIKCPKGTDLGYIETPRWDGQRTYPSGMDSCVTILVPPGHVTMTSFVLLDLARRRACHEGDYLQLYTTASCTGSSPLTFCDPANLLPKLYTGSEISLRFVSDDSDQRTGFRFLYSFFSSSMAPKKPHAGKKWECPEGGQLIQHFLCSPDIYCEGKEDKTEGGCPPKDLCGSTIVNLDQHCYRYIEATRRISWEEAQDTCRANHGYLASLNTPKEWQAVVEMIREDPSDFPLFVGLTMAPPALPEMYSSMWQWSDKTIALYFNISGPIPGDTLQSYGSILYPEDSHLTVIECDRKFRPVAFLCEMRTDSESETFARQDSDIRFLSPSSNTKNVTALDIVQCPEDHLTHRFLQCDVGTHCRAGGLQGSAACAAETHTPMFTCNNQVENVPYTLVCDHRADCCDHSDEEFCVFPSCDVGEWLCGDSKQCIARKFRCDTVRHCVDGSDELQCEKSIQNIMKTQTRRPPALVTFTVNGTISVSALNHDLSSSMNDYLSIYSSTAGYQYSQVTPDGFSDPVCPETHFQCPNDSYCLPIHVRCNEVLDCPGGEDERECEEHGCPGLYHCRKSHVCVHSSQLCDGVFQCPQHDDEMMCDLICPPNCTCYGHAFVCSGRFSARDYPELRYLDATGTGMSLKNVSRNPLLIHLNLAKCGIMNVKQLKLYNLQSLDLSHNNIASLTGKQLRRLKNLRSLSFAFNPRLSLGSILDTPGNFINLLSVNFAGLVIRELNETFVAKFANIQKLNLSSTNLQKTPESGFTTLHSLQVLDLTGCHIKDIHPGLFKDLGSLSFLHADNYKLCCPTVLPEGFNPSHCHAPSDEISSCAALLREDVFRLFLVVYALLTLLGNVLSFVYRVFIIGLGKTVGFDVFVTHLSVSDFLMGMYLAIIGVADRVFYGTYVWNETAWKYSMACKLAGFLSFVSNEVSAFIICLITLERFLIISFPHRESIFTGRCGRVVCVLVWVLGLLLALVPFMPFASHWDFYSQTGICIPLPVTRKVFPGSDYAFVVMIVLNFILFILVAAGQVAIFRAIRSKTISGSQSSKKSREAAIAQRLFAVVLTDFFCWFPIGLLGILARCGFPISGEINVILAIFVLPFNSALNPFLYTFHMVVDQRRKARQDRQSDQGPSQNFCSQPSPRLHSARVSHLEEPSAALSSRDRLSLTSVKLEATSNTV